MLSSNEVGLISQFDALHVKLVVAAQHGTPLRRSLIAFKEITMRQLSHPTLTHHT